MVTQSKVATQADVRTWLDVLMVGFGILLGGIVALMSIWFWLDYQTNPDRSLLAILSTNMISMMPPAIGEHLRDEAQLMGLPLAGQSSAFWYMARAGGIVGYLLLWLSMMWGLMLSTKLTAQLVTPVFAFGLHEFLLILVIIFSILHTAVLLGDSYINFNIFHLIIPFSSPYEPLAMGLGGIGLYLSVAIAASFYIRRVIGQKVWRKLHYLSFVAYGLIFGHGIMAGTDSSLLIVKFMYLGTGCGVLYLIYYRLFMLK